jgi:hypothetical protein
MAVRRQHLGIGLPALALLFGYSFLLRKTFSLVEEVGIKKTREVRVFSLLNE